MAGQTGQTGQLVLFARLGTVLYGADQFIHPLAAELGISLRTVQRWASGAMYPPHEIWQRLELLLATHQRLSAELARELNSVLERRP